MQLYSVGAKESWGSVEHFYVWEDGNYLLSSSNGFDGSGCEVRQCRLNNNTSG